MTRIRLYTVSSALQRRLAGTITVEGGKASFDPPAVASLWQPLLARCNGDHERAARLAEQYYNQSRIVAEVSSS